MVAARYLALFTELGIASSLAPPASGLAEVDRIGRMLEQMCGQPLHECRLIALELTPVLAGQEDDVLVRHVGARDRDGLVGVHLLCQPAGQLHRLDPGPEGTV